MLVLVAGVVAVLFGIEDDNHPSEWDARVVDLVSFVEDARGYDFKHPIHVHFLSPKEYTAEVTDDGADLTEEELAEMEQFTAIFRAVGLVEGDFDFMEAANDLADEGTLAFYHPEEKRIVVRGRKVDAPLEVTLVHELTHALQDQHFDLGHLDDVDDEEAALAYRGLVEGDAQRIENAYVAQLSEKDREAHNAEMPEGPDAAADALPGVPEALIALTATPYAFGEPFLMVLDSDGGERAIDAAFRDPPVSGLQLMNPLRFLDETEPREVTLPAPASDVTLVEDGEDLFGAIELFLMLAQRIDPLAALGAVDTWAGGTYRLEEEPVDGADPRICVGLGFVARADAGPDRLHGALVQWRDAMPGEAGAVVELTGEEIRVRSCDPGPDAVALQEERLLTAMGVPAIRSYLIAGLLTGPGDAKLADCVVTAVWGELRWEHFAPESEAFWESEEFGNTVFGAAENCRG